MNRKCKKNIHVLLVAAFVCLGFNSCFNSYDNGGYYGEYPELHTEAVYSLAGVSGVDSDRISILEQDDFGRVLFCFEGETILVDNYVHNIIAVLVCQKYDDRAVMFYEGVNFLYKHFQDGITDRNIDDLFEVEEIERLKTNNDWNMPLDKGKMKQINVEQIKSTGNTTQKNRGDAFNSITGKTVSDGKTVFLTFDSDGKELFVFMERNTSTRKMENWYFVIFGDGTMTAYTQIKNNASYYTELEHFKQENDWKY